LSGGELGDSFFFFFLRSVITYTQHTRERNNRKDFLSLCVFLKEREKNARLLFFLTVDWEDFYDGSPYKLAQSAFTKFFSDIFPAFANGIFLSFDI
jgi:hypothetical protein